ncbi:hypothetical protein JL721_10408 [Aureococcus anophagefferens]|nr:hypothetical protein JL721_10408 [Aureococcus anophagefferens]
MAFQEVTDESIEREWLAQDVIALKNEVREQKDKTKHRAPSPAERLRTKATKYQIFKDARASGEYSPVREELRFEPEQYEHFQSLQLESGNSPSQMRPKSRSGVDLDAFLSERRPHSSHHASAPVLYPNGIGPLAGVDSVADGAELRPSKSSDGVFG